MSKRLNTSQTNTLLNYFQSPKTPKLADKAPESPTTTPKSNPSTPRSSKPARPKPARSPASPAPVQPTKRKKPNVLGSDSEEENKAPKKRRTRPEPAAGPPAAASAHTGWLHNRLEFLQPAQVRDAHRRRPEHPDYDFRTLHVPAEFLDKQTPAMRQWWTLKSAHMDAVVFFKVGKFYELYHMDAVVGVTQLNFTYMKGEFAHSGFPEQAYYRMANALIEKGYKIARTEQTETPEMMAERCKKQAKTTRFDKVVRREICQITTKATCVYSAQLPDAMHALPCYLLAICEKDVSAKIRTFGVCFIDTSIGTFHLAEFEDDKHCSKLLTACSHYPPGLIITERGAMSPKLKEILTTHFRETMRETLGSGSQFYSADKTLEKLINGKYFRKEDDTLVVPPKLLEMTNGFSAKEGYELAIKSLGACLWYLEDSQLDIQVLSLGKFEEYKPCSLDLNPSHMVLDSITLFNLNLLGPIGSLEKCVDFCSTAFGKRLLHQWICAPLVDIGQIENRQEAIKELYTNPSVLSEAQDVLKKLPDLERQIAKINSYGNRFYATTHPDSRAIFYEAAKYSKRRILDLLRTLRGYETAQQIVTIFSKIDAAILKSVTAYAPTGMNVDLSEDLEFFRNAFDQNEAEKEGKIIPRKGCDDDYDAIEERIEGINVDAQRYLKKMEKFFGCKLAYFGSDKKRFQIDVPEQYAKRANEEFQLESAKKGAKPAKRYSTNETRVILADMLRAENDRSKIVQDLNRRIFAKFSERRDSWERVLHCLATLDVLCSLAAYARNCSHDVCLPEVESLPKTEQQKIVIENGRHPCVANDNFVPNDTQLGTDEEHASVLLITGPNMGGKSTLMRQVAVITVLAQMGSYVPAARCALSVVDRIFTRLGAHDDIVRGQSTFLVELSEASAILAHASRRSLVLLDELGRGTSTHDGAAIATAYVRRLAALGCRALFATHYHGLVERCARRRGVQLGHMACAVEHDGCAAREAVAFLYKMAAGRCPKSFGFNVARLAGLEHAIIAKGREVAMNMERGAVQLQQFERVFKQGDLTVDAVQSLLRSLKC